MGMGVGWGGGGVRGWRVKTRCSNALNANEVLGGSMLLLLVLINLYCNSPPILSSRPSTSSSQVSFH